MDQNGHNVIPRGFNQVVWQILTYIFKRVSKTNILEFIPRTPIFGQLTEAISPT